MVSKFMADVVFGKETDVINFVYNNRSLGQKIKDWIMDTLGITKKAGDNDALLKVKENFEKALGFKAENAQKVQYDIKTDKFGNKYWQVETEQDIFKGIESTKELQKKAFEYILRGNKGERVEDIINGEKLKFTRISAEEYVYGIQSQKLSKADTNNEGLYDKKMRLSPSILDLIENADSKYKMKDMKSHNFAKDGFLNYKGRVKIDNIIFKYIVRIGKSEKGNMFYDTNLEVEQRVPGAKSTSPIKHSTFNDVNILSQDKTIVNDSIRDNNRDDTAKYDKDINETEQTSNDVETAEDIKEAVKSDDETDLVGSKESEQNLANDEDMRYKEGEEDVIEGIKMIRGKVGGKIPVDIFKATRQSSIKNPDADTMILGRFTNNENSYIAKAQKSGAMYFDMGDGWRDIKNKYSLTNKEMFDYFNVTAINDAVKKGKEIKFSHNPLEYADTFLEQEWDYLKKLLNINDNNLKLIGGFWYVK